jgi:hypothetical protein
MITSIILYGALGLFLALADVSVLEKPLEFVAIMTIVMLIDLRAAFGL